MGAARSILPPRASPLLRSASWQARPPDAIQKELLTLLALSPTYSCDLEHLGHHLGFHVGVHGSLQRLADMLSNIQAQQQGAVTWELYRDRQGRLKVHLVGDVFINSTFQRLWQFYHQHYAKDCRPLTAATYLEYLKWFNCTAEAFASWVVAHQEGALLSPPGLNRVAAPLMRTDVCDIVTNLEQLQDMVEYVLRQYDLLSVMSIENGGQLSLLHVTLPNKTNTSHIIDLITLQQSSSVDHIKLELRRIMHNPQVRKCTWKFKAHAHLWQQLLGIEPCGLLDFYPVCRFFCPNTSQEPGDEEEEDMACIQRLAGLLCPEQRIAYLPLRQSLGARPLTLEMKRYLTAKNLFLEFRKGLRARTAKDLSVSMTPAAVPSRHAVPATHRVLQLVCEPGLCCPCDEEAQAVPSTADPCFVDEPLSDPGPLDASAQAIRRPQPDGPGPDLLGFRTFRPVLEDTQFMAHVPSHESVPAPESPYPTPVSPPPIDSLGLPQPSEAGVDALLELLNRPQPVDGDVLSGVLNAEVKPPPRIAGMSLSDIPRSDCSGPAGLALVTAKVQDGAGRDMRLCHQSFLRRAPGAEDLNREH